MPFIATCVDAIGTVFWDRPRIRAISLVYTQNIHFVLNKLLTELLTVIFPMVSMMFSIGDHIHILQEYNGVDHIC